MPPDGIGRSVALALANSGGKLVIASCNKYGELDKVAKETRELFLVSSRANYSTGTTIGS